MELSISVDMVDGSVMSIAGSAYVKYDSTRTTHTCSWNITSEILGTLTCLSKMENIPSALFDET